MANPGIPDSGSNKSNNQGENAVHRNMPAPEEGSGQGFPPPGPGGPPNGKGPGGPPGGPKHPGDAEPPGLDPTTGALNLPGFGQAFARTIATGPHDNLALWYVDIRNFRSVNPNYGFLVGNGLLKGLVESLRSHLVKDMPISRLGADRIILLSKGMSFDEANDAFHEMADELNGKAAELGMTQRVDLAGGLYYLRDSDYANQNFSQALDYASIAHRKAKRNPTTNLMLFTDEDLEKDRRRITIEQSVDKALMEGQFQVWYQPQIDYTYGEVIGAEALARWNHPELGWISPAEFIPILEKCGKIHDMDLFIWEEACRSASKWRSMADGKPIPISVNVSRVEMFEDGLLQHFLDLREKYNLPPGSIHLEVTESAFVEEADRLYGIIEEIRKCEMLVEMDDFGSGLSSLNMLKDVKVDVVKLDMGFMRTAVNEERGGVVLSSVIRMLQGLDTPIIAEGVETLEQAEMLKNMGCHLMQGFHFARPMPLGEFENYISASSTLDATPKRMRHEANLDELMSFDPASSYLFNNAIGGMILFFTERGSSESIMVNDAFYEACGLNRNQFGNAKVNPIQEIDEASRETMWRAAAEAREHGSALCRAQVRLTKRWIECVIRYISPSARGDIFSMLIYRTSDAINTDNVVSQITQDTAWNLDLLRSIVPSSFVKCAIDDVFTIDFISPEIIESSGFAHDDFLRCFHNSFLDMISTEDRGALLESVRNAVRNEDLIDIELSFKRGFDEMARIQLLGRVKQKSDGQRYLYALLLDKGSGEKLSDGTAGHDSERVIPFDYFVGDDKLVVHVGDAAGNSQEIWFDDWIANVNSASNYLSAASAAKISALARDLRTHPVSGFTDIKCDLHGSGSLRWYHVDYVCDADAEGNTTFVHGYAQDANDQMGSAKWWRQRAETDYLTGLLNRNAVEQDINASMQTNGSGMMFMIDLDNFKRVNDELGHLTGDALLRDVADSLRRHFRDSDVLGRYGGDEFVAFMPLANGDAVELARMRAESIIADIQNTEIPDGSYAGCSIGVAISHDSTTTFYDLLEEADQAMYESKVGGKGIYTIREMS